MPNYQHAYHFNRSAEDQVFIVRQILDERWRHGRVTYLVSLDLRQAFDRIDLHQVPSALARAGVPSYLINRLVKACLTEQTSLQWFGQRTSVYRKTRGIKQGCPLSPKLFVYLLHQALLQLQAEMPELHLGQENRLLLPCLRVYADDILAILTHPAQVIRLLDLIQPCLRVFGLELNVSKTEVLIRDPHALPDSTRQTFDVGNYSLRLVNKMRYLGAYITSTLSRRETISDRVHRAIRASYAVISFVERFKLNWEIARRFYHTVITPTVLYGLKVSTLTKANRDRLRDMEATIIAGLSAASRNSGNARSGVADSAPLVPDVDRLLSGCTIIRKVRVARLLYWAHVMRMDEGEILKLASNFHLPGPLKHGRPCHTWQYCVEQDQACTGYSSEFLRELALDGERFRAFLKKLMEVMPEEVPTDDDEFEEEFRGYSDEDCDTEVDIDDAPFMGFSSEDDVNAGDDYW